MSLGNYKSGGNLVSEFQVSASPWVTSSVVSGIVEYSFPYLTSFFALKNVSGSLSSINVGFTRRGIETSGNYFTLNQNEGFSGDFRLKSIFISGSNASISLVVGLTGIQTSMMVTITGSNGWSGVG